jgi:hypothetical protein
MGPKSDGEKIHLAISCLEGKAYEWVEAYIDKEPPPAWLSNFDLFAAKLTNRFSRPCRPYNASAHLKSLKQTDSVAEYANEFHQAADGLGWNDPPLMDQFYCGLKDAVKSELLKVAPQTDLESFIQMAINADDYLQKQALGEPYTQEFSATPSKSHRFFDQREKLPRKSNLCLHCGLYYSSPDYVCNCFTSRTVQTYVGSNHSGLPKSEGG